MEEFTIQRMYSITGCVGFDRFIVPCLTVYDFRLLTCSCWQLASVRRMINSTMNARSNRSLFVVLLTSWLLGCGPGMIANDPKATQIIARMAKVYSECQTYSDSGTVTTVFHSDARNETVVKHFSTAMVRPSKFRFEFSEQQNTESRYIVWQDGDDVRTWWDVNKRSEREDTLGMALAGATGVSSGSAHTIPALLMPDEIGGRLLTDLEAAKLGNKIVLDGHACYTIEALYAGDLIAIWIDEQTYLVRRIDSTSVFDGFTTTETTVYDPVVDQEVDPKRLTFNAPQ